MVRNLTSPETVKVDIKPPEVAAVLAKVEQQLQEGEVKRALETIGRARISSPWLANAAGVCQLRLGNPQVAVDRWVPASALDAWASRDDIVEGPPNFSEP